MAYSLIANSGIHITTFPLEIRIKEKFSLWFHEWYDTTNGEWILDLAHEVTTETNRYFFKKKSSLIMDSYQRPLAVETLMLVL